MNSIRTAPSAARTLTLAGILAAVVLAALSWTQARAINEPTVASVFPASGSASGGQVVTITGTNLAGATAVDFGGAAGTAITPISASALTVTTPAHAPGPVDVRVTTPNGQSVTSAADVYTFLAGPVVSSVNPASGPSGGGTLVTITGSGFTGATSVTFGATPSTTLSVLNDTTLSATTPPHAIGQVDVVVTTPIGASTVSASTKFTFVSGPAAPVVSAVSPNTGPTTGGTAVSIVGTGLSGTTAVLFGGTPAASFNNISDTQVTAVSPAHVAGIADVIVTTPGGTSAVAVADRFTYVTPAGAPVVTVVSPAGGPVTGGTSVALTGSGFTGATSVTFGGSLGTSLVVTSDTTLTVVAPVHAAGQVDVIVTTPAGSSSVSASAKYTYGGPVVTSLTPTSGPVAGGTVVTVSGTGFTGATSVTFGGTFGTSLTVSNDATLTVTTPAHAAGQVDVLVTTPAGTSAVATGAKFTYGAGPTITGVSPTSGGPAGGTVVTITGSGLTGATSVTFGGAAGTSLTVASDTSLTVTTPAHAAGQVDVIVTTPTGTSTTSATAVFTYTGGTVTYSLTFRWNLIVWAGVDGMSANAALLGQETPDNPATNNVKSLVTAVFRWQAGGQKWEAYFPGSEGVPGANDFTTLAKGTAYWLAVSSASSWVVAGG